MSLLTPDMRDRLAREHIERARSFKLDSQQQAEEAMHHVTLAISYNPLNVTALLFRAHIAVRLSCYDIAITDFSICIQLEENRFDHRRLAAAYGGRGGVFRKINKLVESVTDFTRAVEVEPDNGTWLYELGLAYLIQGSRALAQHFFASALGERVAGRMTDNVRFKTLVCLGTCKLHAGDVNGAEAVFTRGLEIQETAQLLNLLGITYFVSAEYEKAVSVFLKALDIDGLCSEYHINLGLSYFQLGLMLDALKHFENAVFIGKKQAVQYFYRGNTELVLGMHHQSIKDLNDAISMDYSREIYHYAKSLAFMDNGDYEVAEKELKIAVDLNPNFRTAWVHLGLLHCSRGNLFLSLESLTRALELEEADEFVHEFVGLVYFELKYYDLAVESFSRCIELNPLNPVFYFRRGVAFIEGDNLHGAKLDLHEAVHKRDFCNAQALHSLSIVLSRLGEHEEALANASTAVSMNDKNPCYLLHRAECHYALGNYADVLTDVSSLVQLGHESAELFYLCACTHYAQRSFTEATKNLKQASVLQPLLLERSDYCYALGVAYLSAGEDLKEAERVFTKAIDTHPQPPLFFYDWRAKARQKLGDAAGALADLNVVLREEQQDPCVWLRRSFANKSLQRYEASANDFEKAKALDGADGRLAQLSYEKFFEIDQNFWDQAQ